jgi:hypothetical protein
MSFVGLILPLFTCFLAEMYSQERGPHPLLSIQCMYNLVDRLNLFMGGYYLVLRTLLADDDPCDVPADD